MFKEIFLSEMKKYLKQIPFYLYGIIILVFVTLYAQSTDPNSQVFGLSHGKEFNNAPIKIAKMFNNWSIAGIFFVMVFMGRSVVKDFQFKIHDFFFTSRITKFQYLSSRFLSSFLISLLVYLFVIIGFFIGNSLLPLELRGSFYWHSFLYPFLFLVLPNTFIIGSFVFCVSTLSRETLYTYLSSIVLIIVYLFVIFNLSHLKSEVIRIIIDPFAQNALSISTQYWTVSDKNLFTMPVNSVLIFNRLIWLILSAFLLFYTYYKFSMTHDIMRKFRLKKSKVYNKKDFSLSLINPQIVKLSISQNSFKKIFALVFQEWKRIITHPAFIIIFILGAGEWISNVIGNLASAGMNSYLFTSWMVSKTEHLWLYMIPITILFGGLIVWREKDHLTQDIFHSLPLTDFQRCLAKILSIVGIQFTYLFLSMLVGIFTQVIVFQYYDIELSLYFKRFFLMEFLNYIQLTVMVVFIQALVKRKVLGFFISALLCVADIIIFDVMNFDFSLLRWGHFPAFIYSNLNGFNPYSKTLLWYGCYWSVFAVIMFILSVIVWKTSENDSIKQRWHYSLKKTSGRLRIALLSLITLFVSIGINIAYNRYVLNNYVSKKDNEMGLVAYEKQVKPYLNYPQPKVTDVNLSIDLFPSKQSALIKGSYILMNLTEKNIDTLFISLWNQKRAHLNTLLLSTGFDCILNSTDYQLGIYKLKKPILPGKSIKLTFEVNYQTKGFTDNNPETNIVKNGTIMNFGGRATPEFMPQIGINKDLFLSKDYLRKKYNLPEDQVLPILETANRTKGFSTIDRLNYTCLVSTEKNQIALTNGELIKEWTQNDRPYFLYQSANPISYELVLTSGIYQVKKEKYKDIDVEVYYNKKHYFNIDRIIHGFKTSIDLNSFFSNYPHKTLRIIETPAYMSYAAARAYPMMYVWNEDSGFIARINDKKDNDQVFSISAHEMAHHWWGYELMPAEAEGLYLPVESMAEFMNLMCLEREYNKTTVNNYLKDYRKIYLKKRGKDNDGEKPLVRCHHNQSYLAYQKGMLQLYTLKEYIGKDNMFKGLKSFFDLYANRSDIYPLSTDMISALNDFTPDSLKYMNDELFMKIALFDLKAKNAVSSKIDKGYKISFKFTTHKFFADDFGKETEAPFNNHVYIIAYNISGKEIFNKCVFLKGTDQYIEFFTKDKPEKIGVDPNGLLIDKNTDDNIIRVN